MSKVTKERSKAIKEGVDVEMKEKKPKKEDKDKDKEDDVYKLKFGKFKNKTLEQVYNSGRDYLNFLSHVDYINDETRDELKKFMRMKKNEENQ